MPLVYADLCSQCGHIRTKHPSGLCSRCRRLQPKTHCSICGERTMYGRSICYQCSVRPDPQVKLDSAIKAQHKVLYILEQRRAGSSFGEIANALSLSKSTVFALFWQSVKLPSGLPAELSESAEG